MIRKGLGSDISRYLLSRYEDDPGSNEGVIEAVNEYLGDQENAFYFEEIRKLEQRWANYLTVVPRTRRGVHIGINS